MVGQGKTRSKSDRNSARGSEGVTAAALGAARLARVLSTARARDKLKIPLDRRRKSESKGRSSRVVDRSGRTFESGGDLAAIALERRIRAHLPKGKVSVQLTDNRYTMISVRRETEGPLSYSVRLHKMFTDSGPEVTQALARYIAKNDKTASRTLGQFIDRNQHCVRSNKERRRRIVTEGRFHDLASIYDSLNRQYFNGRIDAVITWGQRTAKPKRRNSIKMGSYSVEDKLIRIHRSLDRKFVPEFFVAWVVYHEMLHQVHGAPVVNGRRQFHSKEFLEDEAIFDRFAEAKAWERKHIEELLYY